MSSTVTLKHVNHTLPSRFEPVYDGAYTAYDGLVTLPVDEINHIRALWFRGYQMTPEGQSIRNFQELDEYVERVAAQESAPEMATEPEVSDEGTDNRRQPETTDRVRESESDSSEETPKRRTRSSKRSGSGTRKRS